MQRREKFLAGSMSVVALALAVGAATPALGVPAIATNSQTGIGPLTPTYTPSALDLRRATSRSKRPAASRC
jgi:hypothetical protein